MPGQMFFSIRLLLSCQCRQNQSYLSLEIHGLYLDADTAFMDSSQT
jgi:hypothetical protein